MNKGVIVSDKLTNKYFARGKEFFGIKYPIISGAMTWVSDPNLVAAVSNSGGLGCLAGGNTPVDILEKQILDTCGHGIRSADIRFRFGQYRNEIIRNHYRSIGMLLCGSSGTSRFSSAGFDPVRNFAVVQYFFFTFPFEKIRAVFHNPGHPLLLDSAPRSFSRSHSRSAPGSHPT